MLRTGQLERTLTLLANSEIDIRLVIEEKETTGTKRKRKTSNTAVWRVEQLNGPPQPFSDSHWGCATRDYMDLLTQVPPDAMATIMYEARLVATRQKARSSKTIVPSQGKRASLGFR